MILALLFLFAQSGLELPPLGYFPARNGRVYPLYGMRGNLMIGTPLDEGTTAAIRLDRILVSHSAAGIGVGETRMKREWLQEHRVLFVANDGRRAGWIATAGALVEWSGSRVRFAMRSATGWQVVELDGQTLRELRREPIPGDIVTVDSSDRIWTVSGATVSCGSRDWEMDSPVLALHALHESWILIRTDNRLFAAQCQSPDLTLVPEPEP
jgi:hypothetical protein